MMLGSCEHLESGVISQNRQLSHFIQHLLVPLRVPPNGAKSFPIVKRTGHGWKNEQHEFHLIPPRAVGSRADMRAPDVRANGSEEACSGPISFIAAISRSGESRTNRVIDGARMAT